MHASKENLNEVRRGLEDPVDTLAWDPLTTSVHHDQLPQVRIALEPLLKHLQALLGELARS